MTIEINPDLPVYHVEVRKLTYVRGWPTPSSKPFLIYRDGKYVAAFSTEEKADAYVSRMILEYTQKLTAEEETRFATLKALLTKVAEDENLIPEIRS